MHFNPRFREGSDVSWSVIQMRAAFQSTLPRGKRLVRSAGLGQGLQISIHASAREATRDRLSGGDYRAAFQSTLPRGKRRSRSVAAFAVISFQSTLPQGKRRQGAWRLVGHCNISIHASAREATWACPRRGCGDADFNPRFRKGSDSRRSYKSSANFVRSWQFCQLGSSDE